MKTLETDTKILKKNLEITKLKAQVDKLTSELVELRHTDDILKMSELAKRQLTSELVDKTEIITELQKHIIELNNKEDDLPF